jgi:5-methyltetrahydrofolate--homocysteine methyltransferase
VPEAWNLTHPDVVATVAQDYVNAGAQIILSNTFGGSRIKLAKGGHSDVAELNRAGAQISREAAGSRALVFASIGPTGELIGLTSTYTEQEIEDVFAEQVAAILEGDPDGFVIETFADLTEAKCALRAVQGQCDLPVAVSLTFDEGRRGPATLMGVTPQEAAEELTAAGADLVGANCGGLSDDGWEQVIRIMKAHTDRPIWAKANAGIPQLIGGKSVFPMGPEAFAALGKRLAAAGAKVIGGCCGTSPAHIAALVAALR